MRERAGERESGRERERALDRETEREANRQANREEIFFPLTYSSINGLQRCFMQNGPRTSAPSR